MTPLPQYDQVVSKKNTKPSNAAAASSAEPETQVDPELVKFKDYFDEYIPFKLEKGE